MLHSPSKSLQFGGIKNEGLEVVQTPPNPFLSFLKKHSNKVIKLLSFPLLYSPSFPQHPNIALKKLFLVEEEAKVELVDLKEWLRFKRSISFYHVLKRAPCNKLFRWRILGGIFLVVISQLVGIQTIRDILDILAQCNKFKPSPTCTSSVGFSCLYILMLVFIIIQVLYYTLI